MSADATPLSNVNAGDRMLTLDLRRLREVEPAA